MTWSELPRRCDLFTEIMNREPGTPPSTCRGEIIRVGPSLKPIDWDEPGVFDDCLPGEGQPGQFSEVRLFACRRGGNAHVVSRGTDGTFHLRSSWRKPPTTTSPDPMPFAATA